MIKSVWQSFKNRGFLICLCLSIFLFGGGLMAGLGMSPYMPSSVSDELSVAFGSFAEFVKPFSFMTMLFIFAKNVVSVLLCFALSPFFCVMPFISLSFNGLVVGLVSGMVAGEKSASFVLAGLLPHGIIEIPALLIGTAAAFGFGVVALGAVFSERRRASFGADFRRHLKYLAVAVMLLFAASVIETYITPLFMGV